MPAASSRSKNRRALIAFIAVLALFVVIASITVLALQKQNLRAHSQDELQTEMGLLGELSTDSLLRSDYAAAESLIRRWVARHEYIMRITATMPNGFVIVDEKKEIEAKDPINITHAVEFNGRTLITIHAVGDFSLNESDYSSIVIRISILLMAAVIFLGWLLWWVLQRTAIRPLEAQIQARNEKELELLKRTAELETAVQELDSFSYSISHDLRAPLRAIDGYGHALKEDYGELLDAAGLEFVSRIRSSAQRMGILIDDLLTLSRMTRRELISESVDLSTLARDALARLSQTEPARKVETVIEENVHVHGDPSLLAVVMDNLMQNAWKYTSQVSKPLIEFGSYANNGELVYFVRDNGAGFDMKYADKLFRPFQRLHAPHEFPGAGIGLATVARIIQRHGGRIWAESQPGKGSAFCFTLAHGSARIHGHLS